MSIYLNQQILGLFSKYVSYHKLIIIVLCKILGSSKGDFELAGSEVLGIDFDLLLPVTLVCFVKSLLIIGDTCSKGDFFSLMITAICCAWSACFAS